MSAESRERAVSLAALVVAVCAVVVSAVEAKMNRDQQKNSVWPYVVQGNSFPGGVYKRVVWNSGLGPALVRSFQVRVDGKVVHRWGEVIRALTDAKSDANLVYSSLHRGSVVLPNSPHEVLVVGAPGVATQMAQYSERLATRLCYCSLYGDCWVSDTGDAEDEPKAVSACISAGPDEFQQ